MATHREQVEALALLLAGRECPLKPEKFQGTWQQAYSVIAESETFAEARHRLESTLPWSHVRDILDALPDDRPPHPSLQDLGDHLLPVQWLWEGWIPRGMLSLLGASPGAGKSYLALDLAQRIIEGGKFPDGSLVGEMSRRVIYVDAENVPQLLNERADAWQMNKNCLFPMLPEDLMIDLSGEQDRDRLWGMCGDLEPSLVIVDSLGAASSQGENAVEEVRDLLAFLNSVAVDFDTALLLIHHLRKVRTPTLDLVSINDFRGSGHIVAMARSILGLSIIQESATLDRNGPRRLEIVKTNLAQYPPPIGVRLIPLDSGGVRLEYGDSPKKHRAVSKIEECMEWLLDVLEEMGSIPVCELVKMTEEEGFGERMLYRARKRLGEQITDSAGFRSPDNEWQLATKMPGESDT